DLDDRHGFLTPYEQAKYRAERLVRHWARRYERPVTVLRPAVLVTARRRPPAVPRHPLAEVGARMSLLSRGPTPWAVLAAAGPGPLRFPGRPDATTNLLPVEYAVEVMARLSGRTPLTYTDTFHITHPAETPLARVLAAARRCWPELDVRIDPACTRLGPAQRALAELTGGITAYSRVRRRYDRTLLGRALKPAVPVPPELSVDYLGAALGPVVTTGPEPPARPTRPPFPPIQETPCPPSPNSPRPTT
ncbi:SDR family oxidoreductase, partial [Streptomyces sp. NPDC049577]|uniref:SDR family oxidoreductase n=1 Tax=Streptomyces sp. NPDC049577 TaxID=3155153 RepID=UPI00341CBCB0